MSPDAEWQSLRRRLEALKQAVAEEIRVYPPSIPACDVQFNHLLELRRLLPRELERLTLSANDQSITVEEFIRSLPSAAALSKILPED